MAQIIIPIGSLPNDGKGAPIRSAFDAVNQNFANVFGTGLVDSNLSIQNNSILSTNVNGEIRLVPNGTGQVVSNAHVIPNQTNVRNLGSTGRRWRSVYTQYTDTVNQNVWGTLTVSGNLVVTGNTVTANVSTLNVSNLTITLADGAISPGVADGAGILIAGADANLIYSAASNTMNFNVGVGVDGYVQALGFIGDGGGLSNLQVDIDSSTLAGNTLANNIVFSSLTTVGTLSNLLVAGNITTGGVITGNGSGLTGVLATGITGVVANAAYATLAQNALAANVAAQAVFATTANHALTAGRADRADFASQSANAEYANTAFVACTAHVANLATLASNAIYSNTSLTAVTVTGAAQPNITSVGPLTSLSVTGNLTTVGGIFTDNYFFANGAPFTGGGNGGGANYSNANVQAFLPTYSGNLGAISVTGISSNNYLWANGAPFTGTYANANVIALMASGNVPFISTANTLTTSLTVPGYSSLTQVGISGNAVIGNIFSDRFFYANGVPIVFGGGGGNAGGGGVIGDQQLVPDGVSATYPLLFTSSSTAVVVSVNGLTQPPTVAYTVTGNSITFASVPAVSDYIDIRFFKMDDSAGAYGDGNVVSLLGRGAVGNIIPSGNAVYNLGNATNQWRSLYVSGNTIFINNIPLSVTSVGNRLNWGGDNVVVSSGAGGNITTVGNISANYLFGNGRFLTGLPPTYTDSNVSVFLASGTNAANITTTANVRGNYILGNGALLTGTYSNATAAAYLPTYTGGLPSLTGPVATSANITGQFIFGNARFMTGLPVGYGNANVQAYLPTYTGNLASLTGQVTTTANVGAAFFNGNGRFLTGIISSYGDANVAAFLASGNNTANIRTTGNISGGNVSVTGRVSSNTLSVSANITAGNVLTNNYLYANGTPVTFGGGGVLGDQQFVGNGTTTYPLDLITTDTTVFVTLNGLVQTPGASYVTAGNQIIFATPITASDLVDVRFLANATISGSTVYNNANVAAYLPSYPGGMTSMTGPVTTTGNISGNYIFGNGRFLSGITAGSTYGNSNVSTYLASGTNGNNITTVGNVRGTFVLGNGAFLTGTYNNNSVSTYLASGTNTANITTDGNVRGQFILGNARFMTGLPQTYTNSNVAAYLPTYTGNLVSLTGVVQTTANVNGAFFNGNGRFLTGVISSYGNANVATYLPTYTGPLAPSTVTATGNVVGAFILGNSRFTTGLSAVAYSGSYNSLTNLPVIPTNTTQLINGNGFITAATANVISVNGLTGIVTVPVYTNANVDAYLPTYTGNISAGNVAATVRVTAPTVTAGNVSISGNAITSSSGTTVLASDIVITGNLEIQGNSTIIDSNVVTINDKVFVIANNSPTGSAANGSGIQVADADFASMLYSNTANAWVFSIPILANGALLSGITGANITGTVANANYALFSDNAVFSGTVTTNAQPNITSVGTLANLTVAGNVDATFFNGNGRFLSGMYSNADVAQYLPTYGGNLNPGNVSTLGNITGNTVTAVDVVGNTVFSGNIISNNFFYGNGLPIALGGGLLGAQQFTGNGATTYPLNIITTANAVIVTLNGLTQSPGTAYVVAGNVIIFTTPVGSSDAVDIRFISNASVNGSTVYNDANVAAYLPTYPGALASLTGAVTTTGNITGNYLIGNGALITGIGAAYSNANATSLLANLTTDIVSSANISGAYFIGNGSALVNITGANVVGAVASATSALTANTADTATLANTATVAVFANAALLSATVTTNAQPNITSVGTLTALTVTGNIDGAFFNGNGRFLTGVISSYGDANVATYLPTYTGNLVNLAGNIVTTANITAQNFIGNGALLTDVPSSYGNANVAAYLPTHSGNIGGTLTTAAQTGITALGQLTSLGVSGQTLSNTLVTIGNANVGTNLNTLNVRATGTVTAPNLASKSAGQVARGTAVTLNNLRALVPAAGNASLQVVSVSGAAVTLVGSEQAVTAGVGGTASISVAVSGTAAYLNPVRTMTAAGDLQVCNIIDTVSGVGYRITLVIGAAALDQITIEQLY